MNTGTLKALKLSIEHWRRLAAGKERRDEKPSLQQCKLCSRFFENNCEGCPVAEETRITHCGETPFKAAYQAFNQWKYQHGREAPFRAAAKKELAFLELLLPKKPRK